MNEQNWAGNLTYQAAALHKPATIDEVQTLVEKCAKVKVLGTRHCFNDIADTVDGDLISLEHLNSIDLDLSTRTVTVGGGVRYGELSAYLHPEGWALHNLASLPHISVAGAVATATHGSGVGNGSLATAVVGLEFVTATGEIVSLTNDVDGDRFMGAVVGLGGLGAVTKVTLSVEPTFDVRQDVYLDLPFAAVEANFDAVISSAYSVSLFTDWQDERFTQVWLKSRTDCPLKFDPRVDFFGARAATRQMHPLDGNDPINCTDQLGVLGPWHERLPHFKFGFQPSNGDELQSEYFVDRTDAVDAIRALWPLGEHIRDLILVTEVRTIAADEHWMSPCYRQDSVAFHFTWKKDWEAVSKVLPLIETALAPFDARPHWGKLFTTSPGQLAHLFPNLPDFRDLLTDFDPNGKFRNGYLYRYVFGAW